MENQEGLIGKITGRVIDYKEGIEITQGIRAVRIHSKGYVLLIMEDYAPTLGKIDGDVIFLTDEDEIVHKNIIGYYKHQFNEFTLLIEEEGVDEVIAKLEEEMEEKELEETTQE